MRVRAVVPVYNEEKLLPHFLQHYATFCDSIIVWDNGSTDSTKAIASAHPLVELREFKTVGYDEMAVLGALKRTKEESVGAFDWILFPDCDEFLVALDPSQGLRGVLETSRLELLVPIGYCLIQAAGEAPLDFTRDLLSQRSFGWASHRYSKPIVMRTGATTELCPGKHWIGWDRDPVLDRRLALVHLEMADFEHWVYRKNRRPLSEENIRRGFSTDRFCRPLQELEGLWRRCMEQAVDLRADLPMLGKSRHPECESDV